MDSRFSDNRYTGAAVHSLPGHRVGLDHAFSGRGWRGTRRPQRRQGDHNRRARGAEGIAQLRSGPEHVRLRCPRIILC